MTDPARPDPDQLLARMQQTERAAQRGSLKVYFGASPGVGKTCAMLVAARQLRATGVDVVVGLVETHGRSDTAALLDGLELLPRRRIEQRGRLLEEFDLDGALARRPAVLLVDELAHSNLAGSRHPKRWQDIEELRDAGVAVWTTVNVQHLESLNDVVGGITGVQVRETVPDRVLDGATEIVLIDLPVDELLARLQAGKVYPPAAAERALQHFFRKGNLIALRELALRRTADRVDADVLAYRREQAVAPVWHTRDSLLACVDDGPQAAAVVRHCARLAARLEVPWHAIHVETPQLAAASPARRAPALAALQLAQELGGRVASPGAADAAAAIVAYAREHNLGSLVLARSSRRRRWFGRPGLLQAIARAAPDLVLVQVSGEAAPTTARPLLEAAAASLRATPVDYACAAVVMVLVSLLATPLLGRLDLANIVMLFLLAEVGCAYWLGRGPAVLAAVLGVASFDVFFVEPRFSFAVSDWQYLITFAVMLVVGLTTGQLTAGLRFQARVARSRERRAQVLFEMARELSSALSAEQVAEISDRALSVAFDARVALLLQNLEEKLEPLPAAGSNLPELDPGIAQWAYDRETAAGLGTDTLPGAPARYLPLKAPMRTRGVLVLVPRRPGLLQLPEQQRLLETFAHLIAIALERVHYTDVARTALVRIESERLRNSLLAALSHDLRTPLTALVGFADALARSQPALAPAQGELASALREEALRTAKLVENLLDMARIEAGEVQLRKSWWPLEEVVGAALQARASVLAAHPLKLDLPADLPLVEIDAVLLERVLCNLLENAAKYSPPGTPIEIVARARDSELELSIGDHGSGFPAGAEERMFEKFVRGSSESAVPGVGLGLAICRSIVAAHGGRISAVNRPGGGALLSVVLPLGHAPAVPVDVEPQ